MENLHRQPVHTVYGGAHLFKPDTIQKLGRIALRELKTYAPDAASFGAAIDWQESDSLLERVYERVVEKLEREPVEDFRVDFEDGYGIRAGSEEDAHAAAAAEAMASAALPSFCGIRIKPLTPEQRRRPVQTLDIFLRRLLSKAKVPPNFVITLPKLTSPAEAADLADLLDTLEPELGLPAGTLRFEVMIESTQVVLDATGRCAIRPVVDAGRGRVTGAHFGPFDYTSSCGITSKYQDLRHPACDLARSFMQVALGGSGVFLSDGPTTVMPVPIYRNAANEEEREVNRRTVHNAWRLHFNNVWHALRNGFYQGWDLHPAQLPTRYAAVYSFFLSSVEAASERLRRSMEAAAQATLVRETFDDAASVQGLLNFFLRAINCGAIPESDIPALTGLTLDELRTGSVVAIMHSRQGRP